MEWSVHPLGEDRMGRYMNEYKRVIFKYVKNPDCVLETDVKIAINKCLDELIEMADKNEKFSFVLPFLLADFHYTVIDYSDSDKIKDMIKDGGAEYRGYGCPISNEENNYNDFKSPNDYACQLRNNWDQLMVNEDLFFKLKEFKSY